MVTKPNWSLSAHWDISYPQEDSHQTACQKETLEILKLVRQGFWNTKEHIQTCGWGNYFILLEVRMSGHTEDAQSPSQMGTALQAEPVWLAPGISRHGERKLRHCNWITSILLEQIKRCAAKTSQFWRRNPSQRQRVLRAFDFAERGRASQSSQVACSVSVLTLNQRELLRAISGRQFPGTVIQRLENNKKACSQSQFSRETSGDSQQPGNYQDVYR